MQAQNFCWSSHSFRLSYSVSTNTGIRQKKSAEFSTSNKNSLKMFSIADLLHTERWTYGHIQTDRIEGANRRIFDTLLCKRAKIYIRRKCVSFCLFTVVASLQHKII
jgi:hypothetical protein